MLCRLCGSNKIQEVINFGYQPIAKFLLTEQDQVFNTYPIVLDYCTYCSFLQLRHCIPSSILYGQQVNLSSWKNQPHIPVILDELMNLSGINGQSKILEIGCNDGSFLRELKRIGFKHLVGIDPCAPKDEEGICYHQENFYGQIEEYFDLIIIRHVLEHVESLEYFGYNLKHSCKEGTYLLIEVPDFEWFMQLSDYSGIWEEHVNYFTEHTLRQYFAKFGIELLQTRRFNYSGQALFALCMYTDEIKEPVPHIEYRVRGYQNNYTQYKKRLRAALEKCNKDITVYGAGCRATSLINYMEIGDLISFVVDDQLEKQDKFLPGSRLQIKKPGYLYNGRTCLLAVNAENEERVIENHNHFSGQFHSILPMSGRILSI